MTLPDSLLGRRAALMAATIGLALVAFIIAVPIAATFSAQRQEIADSLHQLAVFKAELGRRPALEAELKALRQQGTTGPGLITAGNVSLAQAQLQQEVKSIVDANVSEVRSAEIEPIKSSGGLDTIVVQFDLSVPITHLSALLYAIESHTPYLFIDRADISSPMGWQPPTQPAAKKQPEPKLSVRLAIRAYRWSAK